MSDESTAESLSPMEMAARCGVSTETLRYYEREGLLNPIGRTDGNQRRYRPDDAAWVAVLRCLRASAMPVREMKRFAELVRSGQDGLPGRVELLRSHRAQVIEQRTALDDALELIDHKIEVYSEALSHVPDADKGGVETTPTIGGQGIRNETHQPARPTARRRNQRTEETP